MTEPRAKLLDLSLTQLIGGSLAAATAAALGSRLGVAGTIAGAAVGSVVTAMAASLYTNSMARAQRAIVTTWRPGDPLPRVVAMDAVRASEPVFHTEHHGPERVNARRGFRAASLLSAAAVFLVAGAFLAGFQLATGTSVTGTNVGTRQDAAGPADPGAQSAGQAPSDQGAAVPNRSATTSPDPTTQPAATQTSAPLQTSPGPSATVVTPTQSPTPATPTASGTPVPPG